MLGLWFGVERSGIMVDDLGCKVENCLECSGAVQRSRLSPAHSLGFWVRFLGGIDSWVSGF